MDGTPFAKRNRQIRITANTDTQALTKNTARMAFSLNAPFLGYALDLFF